MENLTFYLNRMRAKQHSLLYLKGMFKLSLSMLTLLLATAVLSAQANSALDAPVATPNSDVAQSILAGCSLSLNHDNVECFGDLAGFLEVEITTAVEGDHTFTWTYQEFSGGPFLTLPSSIPAMEVMNLPAYSTPTSVTTYMDIPAGYYFLTVTGPSLPNGEEIFCEASATIIVTDFEAPTITCPEPFEVTAPMGRCDATVDVSDLAAAIDSCGVTLEADTDEVTLPVGVNNVPVVYTATDDSGNVTTALCNIEITVKDEENPDIQCPTDIIVGTDPLDCEATVSWDVIGDDNCDVVITTMCIFPDGNGTPEPCMSGEEYPIGTTIVTGTAVDPTGNQDICNFQITVADDEPPVVNCPENITVSTDPGACGANVIYDPTATDNCGVESNGTDVPSGSFFGLGTTTVTYTATDAAGNSSTCEFTVTVVDNEPPALDCPDDRTVTTSGSGSTYDCEATVPDFIPELMAGTDGSYSDNCDAVPTQSPAPGTVWGGSHNSTQDVVITVTDGSGNSTTCSLTMTLVDDEDPIINNCPENISIQADPDANCTAPATWTPPTDTDNCTSTMTASHQPGDIFSGGVTTVTYVSTDEAGNSTTCEFTVTITDSNPEAVCNATNTDVTLSADANCEADHSWTNPDVITCETTTEATPTCTYNGAAISCDGPFPLGTTDVTFPGVASACDFTITVIDDSPPTVDPQDVNESTSDNDYYDCDMLVPNYQDPIVDGAPNPLYNATDNCDVTVTQDPAPGTVVTSNGVCDGPVTVTVVATDSAGNSDSGTATLTLNDDVDPLITCPANITVQSMQAPPEGCIGEDVTIPIPVYVPPTVDPNTGEPIAPTHPTDDPANGAYTDDCDCVDLSGPVVGNGVILDTSNTGTFPLGTTTVSYTATDAAGNFATCTFTVTVLPPDAIIECNGSDAASATLSADENCEAPHTWPVPTLNACGMMTPLDAVCVDENGNTFDCAPGDTFQLGTTQITYADAPECNLSVTVVDDTPPTVDPQDVNESTSDNDYYDCDMLVPNYQDPIVNGAPNPLYNATDNCDVTVTQDPAPGTVVTSNGVCDGPVTVTVTATDSSGNSDSGTATLTLNDDVDPLITCPANITVQSMQAPPEGCIGEDVTIPIPVYVPPTVDANGDPIAPTHPTDDPANGAYTDDCDCVDLSGPVVGNGVILDTSNTGTFPLGTTTVSYTATDAAGNFATCTFTVTVLPPDAIIECNGSDAASATLSADANCEAVHSWPVPTLNACGMMTPLDAVCVDENGNTFDCAPGDTFQLGTTQITYADAPECNLSVTVVDDTPPTLECPADRIINTSEGNGDYDCVELVPDFIAGLNAGDGSFSDNCGATATQNPAAGTPWGGSHEATQDVVITVTDGAGNAVTCEVSLTLIDDEDPIINDCPDDISIMANADCTAPATWTPPTPDDNCTVTMTSTHEPGDIFTGGTTTVTYTATDGAGNSTTCSFTVTVGDSEPVTDCMGNEDTVYSADENCDATHSWIPPSMSSCNMSIIADAICNYPNGTSGPCMPGDNFPLGTTEVTFPDLGTDECDFTVTVNDDTPPTFDADPAVIPTSENGVYDCGVTVPDYLDPSSPYWINLEDNCGAVATQDPAPGTLFGTCHNDMLEVTIDVYNDSDMDGVADSTTPVGSETVTVTLVDDVDPLIACPPDVVITTEECDGADYTVPSFSEVEETLGTDGNPLPLDPYTYADDCSTAPGCLTIDVTIDNNVTLSGGDSGTGTFPPGTTTLTYTVTDGAGNTATCIYTVTIIVEEELTFNCPSTIKVPNDEGECGADVYWNPPVVFGECTGPGGSITIPAECTYPDGTTMPCASGDYFPVGITTVVMGDADDNCSFEVRVLDTEKPVIECPEDITVSVAGQGCKAWVEWDRPTPTDNCEVITFNGTHSHTGMYFPVGTTTVIYKAVDAAGNTGTCNFTITVVDDLLPEAACPADITLSAPGAADWTPPNPVDNCVAEGVLILATHEPGDFFNQTTTVTYMFEDAAGNVNECSFTVTVGGGTSPRLAARAAMEGASMNGSGMMRDDLRQNPLMPASFGLVSPYGDNTGINSAMLTSITDANVAVDWILIEIRDANNPAQVVMDVSALVQRDGDIMAADGSSYVTLNGLTNGDYHVAIRHRNHLGIMTANPVYLDASAPMLDFTDANFQTWGTDARVSMGGKMVMIAGDATGDGAITAADRSDIWNNRNVQSYMMQDCDMNGATTAADRNISYNNRNIIEQLPQ